MEYILHNLIIHYHLNLISKKKKKYKLIRFYGPDVLNNEEWEFYDLKKDPSEMNNIYSNTSKTVSKLKKELTKLRREYKVK
jgi:hypothetical protein